MQFLPANLDTVLDTASSKHGMVKKAKNMLGTTASNRFMLNHTAAGENTFGGSAKHASSSKNISNSATVGSLNQGNSAKTSFQALLQQQKAKDGIDKTVESPSGGKLSRADLLVIRDALSAQGISGDRLNRLNDLIESGKMISGNDILKALLGEDLDDFDTTVSCDLTAMEKKDLRGLLRKFGFSEEETDTAVLELEKGEDLNVWQLIDNKLASMPVQEIFDVSKEEIAALSRALRLPDNLRENLEKMFTGNATLNAPILREMLTQINTEMTDRAQSDHLLRNTPIVAEAVDKVLELAKDRKDVEDKSGNRQSRAAQHMSARINDKAISQGEVLPTAAPNQEDQSSQVAFREQHFEGSDDEQPLSDHNNDARQNKNTNSKSATQVESGNNPHSATRTSAADSFVNKVISADPSLLGATNTQNSEQATRAQTTSFTGQLFNQVESGILRSLNDGVKQITLQLDPGDLGTLTLVVSVREKEVSAVLRPDNPETARLIEEQLHKVRNALEAQGLKVDHLEVQSNTAENDFSQHWQDASQHNSQREDLEFRERARLLHRLRHADDAMAHNVQNTSNSNAHAAKNSQSEVYIVA